MMAITAPVTGGTGNFIIEDSLGAAVNVAIPSAANSPGEWVAALQALISALGAPHNNLLLSLVHGRLKMASTGADLLVDPPSFMDTHFRTAGPVGITPASPYVAARPNSFGWYLGRAAVQDVPVETEREAVALPSDATRALVVRFGRQVRRRVQVRYSGTETATVHTERSELDAFFAAHMRAGAPLRYHRAGETATPYAPVTAPTGYVNVVRIGPSTRDRTPLVPTWYEHWLESFDFLEVDP